jgi:hypothetical protein
MWAVASCEFLCSVPLRLFRCEVIERGESSMLQVSNHEAQSTPCSIGYGGSA